MTVTIDNLLSFKALEIAEKQSKSYKCSKINELNPF